MDSEHKGRPQRPPASAHLMVASTDRYATFEDRYLYPATSANWTTNKLSNLLYGYFTRVAITQLNFEWRIPTIVPDKNDAFVVIFKKAGIETEIVAVITPGFYDGDELASEIQTTVRNDPNYDNTWAFTAVYTGDGAFNFSTALGTQIALSPILDNSTEGKIINRFYQIIGANENDSNFSDELVTSPAPMIYTRWVDITSSRLTQFQRVKDGSTLPFNITDNIIARVYASPPNVLVNPSSATAPNFSTPWVMTIDYNTPKHIKWEVNQAINNFDIQVFDEYGEAMYWSPDFQTEYNFTFLASET